MKERLQKFLAAAGVGSRRACEQLIREGRVTVNGRPVCRLPVLIDPDRDKVRLDGRSVMPRRKVYFLLNKPAGVVCTSRDPAGRRRAIDVIDTNERIFPVGRLDADTTGLLVLTNDGELALRLTHPRYGIEKTYLVQIDGRLDGEQIQKLRRGIWLSEGKVRASAVKVLKRSRNRSLVEITLREGRNRQVRRMLAKLGHKVRRLSRIRIGPLTLRGLKPAQYRTLRPQELQKLWQMTEAGKRRSQKD